ncbi:MAG: hypothetical protein B7Z12_14695 [Caulobacter vibrioides]|uniref:Uncharacterized protein n=1 Tax=Caulobacter vibrioides TaxID=155892 RepID=A0A258CZT7_CAUVI|nr:MAG: hypothetical protein B7Z12_14695 [Caulobacter vibrioides]
MSGASQNTIGAVAAALERAFKLGRDGGNTPKSPAISWEEIPPRAREALEYLGIKSRPIHGLGEEGLVLVPDDINGRTRWRVEGAPESERTYPAVAINPLVKLGLLEAPQGREYALQLSPVGAAVFDDYWARRLKRDPTLPIEGMRPTKGGW